MSPGLSRDNAGESKRDTVPPSITTPRERRSLLTAGRDTLMEHRQDRLEGNGKTNPQSTGLVAYSTTYTVMQIHTKGQKARGQLSTSCQPVVTQHCRAIREWSVTNLKIPRLPEEGNSAGLVLRTDSGH